MQDVKADESPTNGVDSNGLYAYINSKGEWVENGQRFHSVSGGEFTDRIAYDFSNDVATLAPLPKLGIFGKLEGLLFKPQYENTIDVSNTIYTKVKNTSKNWINKTEKLRTPQLPDGIETQSNLGKFLNWGTGPDKAALRTQNITKFEVAAIQSKGFTESMARQWRTFYANDFLRNPNNLTAKNRVALMNRIIELMGEIK